MSLLRSQSPLKFPQTHTVLPSPSAQSGVPHLRKEVEDRDSGSRHPPCGKKGALSKPHGPNTLPKPLGPLKLT